MKPYYDYDREEDDDPVEEEQTEEEFPDFHDTIDNPSGICTSWNW